jgi:hypothetical protein
VAVADDEPLDRSPETETRWQDVLRGINARKRMLGAFLEVCQLVGRCGVELRIGMDDLRRVVVEEQENRALIGEEIRRVFGEGHVLRCVSVTAAPAPSVAEHRPMVDQAIAWFQGETVVRSTRKGERPQS